MLETRINYAFSLFASRFPAPLVPSIFHLFSRHSYSFVCHRRRTIKLIFEVPWPHAAGPKSDDRVPTSVTFYLATCLRERVYACKREKCLRCRSLTKLAGNKAIDGSPLAPKYLSPLAPPSSDALFSRFRFIRNRHNACHWTVHRRGADRKKGISVVRTRNGKKQFPSVKRGIFIFFLFRFFLSRGGGTTRIIWDKAWEEGVKSEEIDADVCSYTRLTFAEHRFFVNEWINIFIARGRFSCSRGIKLIPYIILSIFPRLNFLSSLDDCPNVWINWNLFRIKSVNIQLA